MKKRKFKKKFIKLSVADSSSVNDLIVTDT